MTYCMTCWRDKIRPTQCDDLTKFLLTIQRSAIKCHISKLLELKFKHIVKLNIYGWKNYFKMGKIQLQEWVNLYKLQCNLA